MTDSQKFALVTGATGFTGGHLARTLLREGYRVRALVRNTSSPSAQALAANGIEVFRGDVGDADAVERSVRGVSHVFHIAAVYRTANHSDSYYYRVNRDSVAHVLAAAERHGVERVVHCSTCGVHGDVAEIPANEKTAFNPSDVYQRSKLAGELIAQEAMAAGAPVSVVRPTGIYGPGDLRFLKIFRTIENRTFRMFGSGEIAYHMSYIDDLVRGFILCATNPAAIGEVFLIGSDEHTTLNGLVHQIARVLDVPSPSGHLPIAPLMAAATACELVCRPFGIDPPLHRRRVSFFVKARAFSVDKAKRLVGYEPRVTLAEGLARTAAWYRENGHLRACPRAA
jgi:dihydroflavonol-4-reductase